ncbi:Phospholipase C-P1 nuclease domain superfamily [Babesia duncani]|uniref:Phospholipase C-P1 nuclease domain superfamily n=1 Tax=Babesia duncani TaxID=323732 RepID=A0AAD9UMK0_9APIC|nr:Phospholipase C-P1 nuclease domain superfamily [Babesia duncani]
MNSGYPIRGVAKPPTFTIPSISYSKEIRFSPADCIKYLVVLISDLHHPLHFDFKGKDSVSILPVNLESHPEMKQLSLNKLGTARPMFSLFLRKIFIPEYVKHNEEAWYGAWTNVELLGSRYVVESEAFNRNTWSSFEIWGSETANLICSSLLDEKTDIGKDKSGRYIVYNDNLAARLAYIMRVQIMLAGVRVAIVLNYVLSHREIGYDENTGLLIDIDPASLWTWEDYLLFPAALLLFGFFYGMIYIVYRVLKEAFQEYKTKKDDVSVTTTHNRNEYEAFSEM